jgi:hypothetical protein
MANSKTPFTIGYEPTPAKAVLDELEQAGVKLLADVCAVAASPPVCASAKVLDLGSMRQLNGG